MSKHTPGPWSVNPMAKKEHQVVNNDGYIVAVCTNVLPLGNVDAHLVAAAPEMLEALKMWIDHSFTPIQAFRATKAAIEKAEGK